MAKLKYNLDDIQDFAIDAGKHRARLKKVEQTLSKKKKPMLVWHWKIVSGPEKNKEMRSWTSLEPTALGNLKNHLMAFGLRGKVNSDTSKFIGKYVILVVTVAPSTQAGKEDQLYSSVSSVLPDKASRRDADEDDEDTEDDDAVEDDDEDLDDEEDEDQDEEEESEDEDEDEDEEADEDEEEEEPAPRRKVKPKSKTAARTNSKVVVKKKSRGKVPF